MARDYESATQYAGCSEHISASVIVQASAAEVYEAWSGLGGLPRLVANLCAVRAGSGGIVEVKASLGGDEIRWDTEFLKDRTGRTLSWRSVGAPPVPNAGWLSLHELPFCQGTEVRVDIEYVPPHGPHRDLLDKIVGANPRKLLHLCLFRFRQLLEGGELATTKGRFTLHSDDRDHDVATKALILNEPCGSRA